jgi:hypothetical protein
VAISKQALVSSARTNVPCNWKLVSSNLSMQKTGPVRYRVRPALLISCGAACGLEEQGLLGSKESSPEADHHGAQILMVRNRYRRACTVP